MRRTKESKRDYGRNDQTTAKRFSSTSYRGQFSVFSRRKLAGAAGSLLPARVRHWRTSRQWGPQVLTNWSMLTGWVGMGPNWEKSFAHLCTRLHMPGHFLHMPEHPQTCLYMPEHACTTVESPSPKHKRRSEHLPSLALRASEPRGGCAIADRVRYSTPNYGEPYSVGSV